MSKLVFKKVGLLNTKQAFKLPNRKPKEIFYKYFKQKHFLLTNGDLKSVQNYKRIVRQLLHILVK